jgi:predicted MFS family arabinose efflux permease
LLGILLSAVGLLFIGPSPWFGTAVPQTHGIVLMGAMICYAGVAIFVPAMLPLALDVFERAGYKQRSVAGVVSAMFTLIICAANFVGAPLGGLLIDQLSGVPITTSVFAAAVVGVTACTLFPLAKYVQLGRSDKAIASSPMPSGLRPAAPP